MITAIVSGVLYFVALGLMALAAKKHGRRAAFVALARSRREFLRVVPRLGAGVIGAGFLARLLPQDAVVALLGPDTGIGGIAVAAIAGALTPGGPVIGYSLAAAALKAGAGLPQIMAYLTGWALYSLQRLLVWELEMMPRRFIGSRVLASLPFPFLVAGLALLSGGR